MVFNWFLYRNLFHLYFGVLYELGLRKDIFIKYFEEENDKGI